ncbi:hypothetical protein [Roseivivax sp. CAU 1761]
MANDWIIDVLSDLGAFARANGMAALAGELEGARCVARAEITRREGALSGLGRDRGYDGQRARAS